MCYFTWKLELVSHILWVIVEGKSKSKCFSEKENDFESERDPFFDFLLIKCEDIDRYKDFFDEIGNFDATKSKTMFKIILQIFDFVYPRKTNYSINETTTKVFCENSYRIASVKTNLHRLNVSGNIPDLCWQILQTGN